MSTNRSNSFGARLRSGSLSNVANQFKNGNSHFNQNFNDFDDTTQDEGTLSDSRSRGVSSSVHDLTLNRNMNNPWQMPQQFPHPFGYMPNQPLQYHVTKMFIVYVELHKLTLSDRNFKCYFEFVVFTN